MIPTVVPISVPLTILLVLLSRKYLKKKNLLPNNEIIFRINILDNDLKLKTNLILSKFIY